MYLFDIYCATRMTNVQRKKREKEKEWRGIVLVVRHGRIHSLCCDTTSSYSLFLSFYISINITSECAALSKNNYITTINK